LHTDKHKNFIVGIKELEERLVERLVESRKKIVELMTKPRIEIPIKRRK